MNLSDKRASLLEVDDPNHANDGGGGRRDKKSATSGPRRPPLRPGRAGGAAVRFRVSYPSSAYAGDERATLRRCNPVARAEIYPLGRRDARRRTRAASERFGFAGDAAGGVIGGAPSSSQGRISKDESPLLSAEIDAPLLPNKWWSDCVMPRPRQATSPAQQIVPL